MIPIVTPEEMEAIDADAPEPVGELIDRAGRAVAREALDLLGGTYGRVVVVLAGKGNNGADGRSAAVLLERRGVKVHVVDAAMRPPILPAADLVIDAAFGTGFHGDWRSPELRSTDRQVFRRTRPRGTPGFRRTRPRGTPGFRRTRPRGTPLGRPSVLAVDIPSGVDAATGQAGNGVLCADRTVTFQALKPGLVFGRGRELSGEVVVADIGLDVSRAVRFLVEADDVASWLVARSSDAHKWNGAVRIVAGSDGMLGAGELCAAAAARAGAGLVALSSPGATASPPREVVQRPIPAEEFAQDVMDDLQRYAALAIGPGLGRSETTIESVRRLIEEAVVPVVVDGDALFAAAWSADGAGALIRPRTLATVVTPHDGEYAILDGAPPSDDRVEAARSLAVDLDCTVLLKGPTTVVAARSGPVYVIANGDERLATAGTGDVLTGIVAAQLATGLRPEHAAACAAWIHAAAAGHGPRRGLIAGDLIDALPEVLGALEPTG